MFILRLHCTDAPGIVAAVATALARSNCNIEESSQFHDSFSGRFFMRVVWSPLAANAESGFRETFAQIAAGFQMKWSIDSQETPVRALVLVSKDDHCLNDLLYRWRTKHLNIDIAAIASNHGNNSALVESHGLPFHRLPTEKAAQEKEIAHLAEATGAQLIVLARYMQILSATLCARYEGRIINIHHSFLPGFKGAKPYHQAYERGVKIIGATAHFATEDLDEGPIIAQETVHVDHTLTPLKMQALGRDTESRVLAKAIALYAERRIFLHGKRTIIL